MQAIAWLWTATVVWLFVIPTLLPEHGVLAIGSEASAVAAAAAVALVGVPRLRRLDVRWTLLVLLPVLLGVRLLARGGVVELPLSEALELGYVAGAVVLATGVGRRLLAFERGLEALAAGGDDPPAESFDEGQQEIYREIRRARRYERPATLLTVASSAVDAPAGGRLTPEVLQAITERYATSQVGRLLLQETDASAVITRRGDHFVVLLPETEQAAARAAARRLAAQAAERWGLDLQFGIASFPEQELTLDGLLQRAESELRSEREGPARRRDPERAVRLADARGRRGSANWPRTGG